jgi:YD repeat-containing protein
LQFPSSGDMEFGVSKKNLFVFCTFVLLSFCCTPRLGAQSASCAPHWSFETWAWPWPIPKSWICNLPGLGPWSMGCLAPTSDCPVGAGPAEDQKQCPNCGSPISLATGNTYIAQTDVRLPGISNGLSLVRTWNSVWPATQSALQTGLFGPNWRSTYEERVFTGSDGYQKYARGDGSFWTFGTGSPAKVVAPANVTATLVQGATYWTITFQNGEQRQFSIASGSLTSIIDRNGNTTQLTYDGSNRLVTVTDPASRHLYFGYGSGSSFLVTSVTSDVGLTLSYSYDTQGRLSVVTKPDTTTLSFTYNAQSLIASVLDANGVVLESHTYDSNGRGLTSSRATGVEAVSITYPQ